jgi:hypothetical protein
MSNPGSWEDVVELLVPELQKRGIYWTDYAVPGGTFRENMQGKPGHPLLPDDHPGAKLRWDKKKEDPLEGLRWHSRKVEPVKEKVSNDPLEGYRWKIPVANK